MPVVSQNGSIFLTDAGRIWGRLSGKRVFKALRVHKQSHLLHGNLDSSLDVTGLQFRSSMSWRREVTVFIEPLFYWIIHNDRNLSSDIQLCYDWSVTWKLDGSQEPTRGILHITFFKGKSLCYNTCWLQLLEHQQWVVLLKRACQGRIPLSFMAEWGRFAWLLSK